VGLFLQSENSALFDNRVAPLLTGQGANQAMKDASVLAKQMLALDTMEQFTDEKALQLADAFDAEMYKRAFGK
jgi:2-polyprenyl-6-methoxyphenol hydroxylase-like FAD-dependent oxidoreductase